MTPAGTGTRIRVDGEVRDVNEEIIDKNRKHTIEMVDRLIIKPELKSALRTHGNRPAPELGVLSGRIGGRKCCSARILPAPTANKHRGAYAKDVFVQQSYGACPSCSGLGTLLEIDPDLVIPDRTKSLAEGAIRAGGWNFENGDSYASMYLNALAKHYGFKTSTPVNKLPDHIMDIILYGTKGEKIRIEYDRE